LLGSHWHIDQVAFHPRYSRSVTVHPSHIFWDLPIDLVRSHPRPRFSPKKGIHSNFHKARVVSRLSSLCTMAPHKESDARTSLRVECKRQQIETTGPLVHCQAMTMGNCSLLSGHAKPSHSAMVELQRRRRPCLSKTVVQSGANKMHPVNWAAFTSCESSLLPVPLRRRRKLSRFAASLESLKRVALSTSTLCWLLLLLALVHPPGTTVRAQTTTTTTPGKRRKLMMAMKGMKDKSSMCSISANATSF
jgi:hypothetical protein